MIRQRIFLRYQSIVGSLPHYISLILYSGSHTTRFPGEKVHIEEDRHSRSSCGTHLLIVKGDFSVEQWGVLRLYFRQGRIVCI